MSIENKPIVFVIMPFKEDIFALYEKLKSDFENDFTFTNAGDLDNQQNILKDIVEGIHQASIVIADLTGLNPNVFYELGLAHAMNKKVIIITQDIGELPFDIKSYRTVEYSLLFYKLPTFLEELKKLLFGALDDSVKFGNPVSDFIPDFFIKPAPTPGISAMAKNTESSNSPENNEDEDTDIEKGYLDYITDIVENSTSISEEIGAMGADMIEMTESINHATNEINRVKAQSGSADPSFVRTICRKLATPIDDNAEKMKTHISNVTSHWAIVENSYLSLLDNHFMQNNIEDIISSSNTLIELRTSIQDTDKKVDYFISVLRGNVGIERRLTRAITNLIAELEAYLSMTSTIYSSIERIVAKSDIVVNRITNSIV